MPPPKISVITFVRNGAAFIERCLQSIAEQNYPDLEYIVLDGASTDGTQAIIERYRPYLTIYHSRPDKGAYDAKHQGLAMATGDVVGLLMADDWLSPGALHEIARMYREKPDAEMFCFGLQEYKQEADGSIRETKQYRDPRGDTFGLLDGMYCQGMNRFYARKILKEEGHFRTELYPNLADRDFWVRLGLRKLRKAWTDKVLYNFLVHSRSNSTGGPPAKYALFLDETARIADDYLKSSALSDADNEILKDWYYFNRLRGIFFHLKAGHFGKAVCHALCLLARSPKRTLCNFLKPKMPEPYQAKPSSSS